jgi:hypothetical protein
VPGLPRSRPVNPIKSFNSSGEMFNHFVPIFKGKSWRPFLAKFKWDPKVADFMETISASRCEKRRQTYLIPGELKRATDSIRFGNLKTGRGFRGPRRDFCLIGGCYVNQHLTVFYRRFELLNGHFDWCIFKEVEEWLGPIRTVTIIAVQADVYALQSNRPVYDQLKEFYNA